MVTYEDDGGSTVETMGLEGGEPCLDFVNTASGRSRGPLREKLRGYGDLVTIAERVGVVNGAEGERLRAATTSETAADAAESVLERAKALREAIFRLFARGATAEDLARISEEAGAAAGHRRLVVAGEGYALEWEATDDLARPLWPFALSALALLTSEERGRVKECAADDCSWLFLDMSRNRSRRWCDMAVCGNRAKARRFRAREG